MNIHRQQRFTRPFTVAALALSTTSAAVASVPIYGGPSYDTATNTGFLNATITAAPNASISNDGTAIGDAILRTATVPNAGNRLVRWTLTEAGDIYTSVDPPTGIKNSHAAAINKSDVIVGDTEVYAASGKSLGIRAFRGVNAFYPLEDLGLSGNGSTTTHAYAINAAGLTVGSSLKYNAGVYYGIRPVTWGPTSGARFELGVLQTNLNASVDAEARDVNDAGLVVGYSGIYSNNTSLGTRAVRWNDAGNITALGTLGTDANGGSLTQAIAVNNAGTIIGNSVKYDASHKDLGKRGVRYVPNGSVALELLPINTGIGGVSTTAARSINEAGLIVGSSESFFGSASLGLRPVYWNPASSTAVELPNFGVSSNGTTLAQANAVNGVGCITGQVDRYVNGAFQRRSAVIWTTAGTDAILDLNTLLPANSGWSLTEADGVSDTGFVSGAGTYTSAGVSYVRSFTMLVPQAGTYGMGDANFDTKVDFADLLLLAKRYGSPSNGSIHAADFDLSGTTDFADLLTLAKHYGTSAASADASIGDAAFESDWAIAQSLVPEPSSTFALLAAGLGFRRRGRLLGR